MAAEPTESRVERHPSLAVPDGDELAAMLRDARARTLALVADLSDGQMRVAKLSIVNPLLWEIGHVAWFQEKWNLRHLRSRAPLLERGDEWFDSAAVAHDTRWDLRLPQRSEVLAYLARVLEQTCAPLAGAAPAGDEIYFAQLALFHEDMHGEALAYTRQTMEFARPEIGALAPQDGAPAAARANREDLGDAEIPGGRFRIGADRSPRFVFDNEKWAHEVEVAPFSIARAAVTQAEFAEFVEAGGYARRELWCEAGWKWRCEARAEQPVYWRREPGGRWLCRSFDRWVPLSERAAVLHVNWFEASAFCRFRGRRLPTEVEWEVAASAEPDGRGGLAATRRVFPWGDAPPDATRAHLGARSLDPIGVDALPAGDSAFGCRQMLGNVWEWTADDFQPYPGFAPDPYREYSQPWFGWHKILRGGCLATQPRLLRNTWRNFYTPDRRDVWAGFRTCAVRSS